MSMADLRREYRLGELRRDELAADPVAQFQKWFDQAAGARMSGRWRRLLVALYKAIVLPSRAAPPDVNAATLATADKEGRPSARTILLKGADERGFIFFTNYESRKGQDLAGNPRAALVFYWADHERQVCISGDVRKLPREESEAYFHSRPRNSQIAAWASPQSQVLENRPVLEKLWQASQARFSGSEVPLPPGWGGYVMSPDRIEFWQGRPDRLHDRFCYRKEPGGAWLVERLAP